MLNHNGPTTPRGRVGLSDTPLTFEPYAEVPHGKASGRIPWGHLRVPPGPGTIEEAIIASQAPHAAYPSAASWDFVEAYLDEDQVLTAARQRAVKSGAVPVSPATGATLALIAGLVDATSVAELGTGAGVSGVWLLRGMNPEGVLTTVDDDGEQHRAAREAFTASGVAPQRVRLITGRALDVVTRLTDGGYDMVVIDADPLELDAYIEESRRLLRPGGAVAIVHALGADGVADPAQRDAVTLALRAAVTRMGWDPGWAPVLLPVGDGVLAAVRRPDVPDDADA